MAGNWAEDVAIAAAAAIEAGRAVMRNFGGDMEVRQKAPDQPLTASDLEANRILHERLLGARPEYGWLSEETADDAERRRRERLWIVDPIDGTRSFIAGRREFGISVGIAQEGEAMAGAILNPATGELYVTWRGGGAWKLENALTAYAHTPFSAWTPIHVREPTGVPPAILASRSEIRDGEFAAFVGWEVIPLGSTTYKLAKLAEGAADVFLSRGPKSEWDVCAGGLLVQEAGGIATDLRGDDFAYNRPDPRVYGVLAAPAGLHAQVLRQVRELEPPERLARPAADPLHPGLDEDE